MIKIENNHQCFICTTQSSQIAIIINNLGDLINKRKLAKIKEFQKVSEGLYDSKYSNSFIKLLKFVFQEIISSDKLFQNCEHDTIKNFLMEKAQVTVKQLNIYSQHIYQFQAKRNFQLEILNNQIKSFTSTILDQVLLKPKIPRSQFNFKESLRYVKKEAQSNENQQIIPIDAKIQNTFTNMFLNYNPNQAGQNNINYYPPTF